MANKEIYKKKKILWYVQNPIFSWLLHLHFTFYEEDSLKYACTIIMEIERIFYVPLDFIFAHIKNHFIPHKRKRR